MKKIMLILITGISSVAYGQQPTTSALETGDKQNKFTCQYIEIAPDGKKVLLKENVKIETEYLLLEADSALFDKENQTFTAYGTKHFNFSGGEMVIGENSQNIIRYKLRDKIIYIE